SANTAGRQKNPAAVILITVQKHFAIQRTGEIENRNVLALPPPPPETAALETTNVRDIHQQTAGVPHNATRHAGAGNPAVIDRGRLNGMNGRLPAERVRSLGNITGSVNVGEAGLHAVVDDDSLIDADAGTGNKMKIWLDAR